MQSTKSVDPNLCKNLYAGCDVTFEMIELFRIPNGYAEECGGEILALVAEFRREDEARRDYLLKEACSYRLGNAEYCPGKCEAGGPPPCCPIDHWYKMNPAAAWEQYISQQGVVKSKRQKKVDDLIEKCKGKDYLAKGDKAFEEGDYARAERYYNMAAASGRTTEAEARIQEMRSAKARIEQMKREDEERKRKAEERKEKREEEERKKKEEEEKRNREAARKSQDGGKTSSTTSSGSSGGYVDPRFSKFQAEKQRALDNQRKYDEQNRRDTETAAYMCLLSLGFYMFNSPENRYYNYRGMYFGLGPRNTWLNVPVLSDYLSVEKTLNTNYSYNPSTFTYETIYDSRYTEKRNSARDQVSIPTIGAGLETGYFGDYLNMSFPVDVFAGIFGKGQRASGYSYGGNLFVGTPGFKVGVATDFRHYALAKSEMNTYDYIYTYKVEFNTFNQKFALSTNKIGVRFQGNMDSRNINTEEPWTLDFYLTFSKANLQNPHSFFWKTDGKRALGCEVNFNMYGGIGVFLRYSSMDPAGIPVYEIDTENNPQFFQVGIKRDYTWFRGQ